jgi:hypothetical protein
MVSIAALRFIFSFMDTIASLMLSCIIFCSVLRSRLARVFDACILPRRCKPDCQHKHKTVGLFTRFSKTACNGLYDEMQGKHITC